MAAVPAIGDDAADEREQEDGELAEEAVEPEIDADCVPVSVTISQACATFCIQVPMLEVSAPNQRSRKSR